MYNNDTIQRMIQQCEDDDCLRQRVLDCISNSRDQKAVQAVLREGWYEAFDRYDSAVCDSFIIAFEKVA